MQGGSGTRLHVILRLDPGAEAGRVVRMWFEQAWARLGGSLRDQLAAHPLPVDDIRGPLGAARIHEVFPQVGLPWCDLILFGGDYGQDVVAARTVNSTSWSWFLTEIEGDGLVTAYLRGGIIDKKPLGHGFVGPGSPDLQVRVETIGPIIDQVWLGLSAYPDFLVGTPEGEKAVCAFLRDVAATVEYTYGEISFQAARHIPGASLLENALRHLDYPSKRQSWVVHPKDQLRGYSWVTLVPGNLVGRLGGVEMLEGSGAFHLVSALPAGGVWLQATERLADYDLVAARKVFDVLRPVLIRGMPATPPTSGPLVDEAP
jgi:hypothetical protein